MAVDIKYLDGFMVETYDDGTAVTYQPGHGDDWVPMEMRSDGWLYKLDAQGNPVSGMRLEDELGNPITDPAQQETVTVDNSYDPATGSLTGSTWTYSDGSVVLQDGAGHVTELRSDGWVYHVDAQGHPVNGVLVEDKLGNPITDPALQDTVAIVNIYDPQTHALTGSTWTYSDETVVVKDGNGHPTWMSSDGWTFEDFTAGGRPLAGHKGDLTLNVSYPNSGNAVWDFGEDMPKLTYDGNGKLLTMETSDGWVYDEFDGDLNPLHGTNSKTNLTVDITQLPDHSWEYDYSDGSTVISNSDGTPTEQYLPDGKGGFDDIVFSVDLSKMSEAIELTRHNQTAIADAFESLKRKADVMTAAWSSPAGRAYGAYADDVTAVAASFASLFDEAIRRLMTAYDSYVEVEGANYANLTPSSKEIWVRPPAE